MIVKHQNRIDLIVYLIKCSHLNLILLDDAGWCSNCRKWIRGKEIGDATIILHDNGDLYVDGGGYTSNLDEKRMGEEWNARV